MKNSSKWWKDPEKRKIVSAKISKKLRKRPRLTKLRFISAKNARINEKYPIFRETVLSRDNYTCQECGFKYKEFTNEGPGEYPIQVHHIKSLISIVRKNALMTIEELDKCEEIWDTENGTTLCKQCHKKTDSFAEKAYRNLAIK